MINMVLQSQIDWALLERSDNGKTLTQKKTIGLGEPDLVRWMTRAVLECARVMPKSW